MPPMREEGISVSPAVSTWRWIPETSLVDPLLLDPALAAGEHDRLLDLAAVEPLAPPCTVRPAALDTVTSRAVARARNVVNRPPQRYRTGAAGEIAVLSSVGRESAPGCRHGRRDGQR